jgi:hypothetical protein
VANLVMQLVARAERSVRGVIAADLWRPTLPAWRRAAARATLDLRIAGPALDDEGLARGAVAADTPTVLIVDDARVILAQPGDGRGADPVGVWTSHPLITRVAAAALERLT